MITDILHDEAAIDLERAVYRYLSAAQREDADVGAERDVLRTYAAAFTARRLARDGAPAVVIEEIAAEPSLAFEIT